MLLLFIWVIVACLSLLYNTQKAFFEEVKWIGLSDAEKRYKIFGDIYPFLQFVKTNTKQDSKILLYSDHPMAFYFGIYTLYPRRIEIADNPKEVQKQLQEISFDFVVTYNKEFTFESYKEDASYSAKTTRDFGKLYKRK